VYAPYAKGVSEKFKPVENRYNIRKFFGIKHILRECGRSYIGGRFPAMRLHEHRHRVCSRFFQKNADLSIMSMKRSWVGWDEASKTVNSVT
jgi:hypothetical protein